MKRTRSPFWTFFATGAAAILLIVCALRAQTVITGTDQNGNGYQVTIQPTSQPSTQPVITPPPIVPPVVTPPVVTPPVITPPVTQPSTKLAGMPGQVYATDAWLAQSFTRETAAPAIGNIDLSAFINNVASKASFISTATTPGHLASDFSDFTSAQNAALANGSICILFRDGGTYAPSVTNNNIYGAVGTAVHPFIVSRIGRNGFADHSVPCPILAGGRLGIAGGPGNGKAWGGPIRYVIMDGLDFESGTFPPQAPAAQGAAISFTDTNLGAASDHIGIFDCNVTGYQGGIDLEADDSAGKSYPITSVIIDGCTISNTRGGSTEPGIYCNSINDLLFNRDYVIGCSYRTSLGTGHDIYLNSNYTFTNDSQIRTINTVMGVGAACGEECNRGGFFDHDVSIGNPTGIYGGGGQQCGIQFCVIDGGGGEFDTTALKFASFVPYPLAPGATLSLQSGSSGAGRGWGPYLDCATTGFIHDVYCVNKNDAGDIAVNSGFAVGVHVSDPGKNGEGMPGPIATIATIGPNVFVHNWFVYSGTSISAPNAINLSQSTPPIPTITYTGLVVLPGVTGVPGVTGTEPNYVDPTRTCSTYAKSLGISGVTDGPTLMNAMMQQNSAHWNPALEAQNVFNYVAAGFAVKQ